MIRKLVPVAGIFIFMGLSTTIVGETSLALNIKSGFLVLGGTIIIGFLSFPMKKYRDLFKTLLVVFRRREINYRKLIIDISRLSRINRLYGHMALEKEARHINNFFLCKGIDLIVDGYDSYDIHKIMEKEYEIYFSGKESLVNILSTLQKIAPVIGFLGTIFGLISVLNHLGSPGDMGKGMAVALLTTLYGLLVANFLFLPLHKKLSEHLKTESTLCYVILEGVLDISNEKNSRAIAYHLQSYMENCQGRQSDLFESRTQSRWRVSSNPLEKQAT
ncbi:MAG: MotA/TolQ/ExbB proton channel family protein [Desulfobacterales bacterium]